ncbi:MAG TPA: YhbY family RNA-binding protein [Rhodocyclaceae bacterium]|nr:YhbY family RNA-binding protein [Rhodocyclaceae bacterium]
MCFFKPYNIPMITLTANERRALRARAHDLSPVVSISQKGLTESVLKEIERCLSTHGLIKIRIFDAEREARAALLAEICAALDAAPVQHIGKLLVIWREQPEAESEAAPSGKPAAKRRAAPRLTKKAAAAKSARAAKATPRRRTS